jgi:hypothetical protein
MASIGLAQNRSQMMVFFEHGDEVLLIKQEYSSPAT